MTDVYTVSVPEEKFKTIRKLLRDGYGLESVAYMVGVPIHIVWGVQVGEL